MGEFKPLLPFGDSTVIESCLKHLRGASIMKSPSFSVIAQTNCEDT